jgi:cell division protein FtsL
MINFGKDLLNLSTTRILVVVVLLFTVVLVLVKYPIEYDRVSYEVQNYIETTKTTKYIIQTQIRNDGLRVQMTTKTYYVEIKETPEKKG